MRKIFILLAALGSLSLQPAISIPGPDDGAPPKIELSSSALAVAAEQSPSTSTIDRSRRFTCPTNVNNFCRSTNAQSGCTKEGKFVSRAIEICKVCSCL